MTSYLLDCLSSRKETRSTGKDVVKREHLYIIGENVNWSKHCGKQHGDSSKKLKTDLPYDPAIPLPGI